MTLNNFINKIVYIEYKDNGSDLNCCGKVIEDNGEQLTVGFNFYLNDVIDSISVKKENISRIEVVSLM